MTRHEDLDDLVDAALLDEIELVSDLVVAATGTSRHFTPDEIDRLLGVAFPGQSGIGPGAA